MLNFIKKLFVQDKEPVQEQVNQSELPGWFEKKTTQLDYDPHFQEYFQQIKDFKNQLQEKTEVLKNQQISEKEQKQVEARVRNIVIGHKDHYVRETERFIGSISIIKRDKFSTLEDYQKVLQFNQKLDQEIVDLAKRTTKSYQATQHLFFDQVENVFKLMGKLNLQVKNFAKKFEQEKLEKLEKIKSLMVNLEEDLEKKNNLEEEVKEKEERLVGRNKELKEKEELLIKLRESKDYRQYLELKKKQEELGQKIKENNDQVYFFFSKLNKALRKYERVTLDVKLIKLYLQDSVEAFWNDSELKIEDVLEGLKKNLLKGALGFEEKQKNKFVELIDNQNLDKIRVKGKGLLLEEEKLVIKIKENKISEEIENKEKEILASKEKINQQQTNISELNSRLGKIDLEGIKGEIKAVVKEVFGVELEVR